jgi:hypothetical protein
MATQSFEIVPDAEEKSDSSSAENSEFEEFSEISTNTDADTISVDEFSESKRRRLNNYTNYLSSTKTLEINSTSKVQSEQPPSQAPSMLSTVSPQAVLVLPSTSSAPVILNNSGVIENSSSRRRLNPHIPQAISRDLPVSAKNPHIPQRRHTYLPGYKGANKPSEHDQYNY